MKLIKDPISLARKLLILSAIILLFYSVYGVYHMYIAEKCDWICQFNKIDKVPENSNPEDKIGLSLASLNLADKKEIQNIIVRAFEKQWNYYYDNNENKLDQSIKEFYIPDGYEYFRKEMEKEKQYTILGEITTKNISHYSKNIKDIKFGKPRSYRDLNDIIGMISGSDSVLGIHYFLFKKTGDGWKIEREKFSDIGYNFGEDLIVKELIEKKNNETPEVRIIAYLEAIKQGDELKALEVWQLLENENWKSNPNYPLLEKRRKDITKELIEMKINNYKIVDIKWWVKGACWAGGTCSEPSITDDSSIASGASISVELSNSADNKLVYIFDIFNRETTYNEAVYYEEFRKWILRDIYPENQEPLFWKSSG